MPDRQTIIAEHFRRSSETLSRAAESREFSAAVLAAADAVTRALRSGGKLILAGNGGSAADAQHIAAEFVGRLNFDRRPLPAIALTTDTSILTAVGNDYGFEDVFARQVRGLGHAGDALLAISTSGQSPNVLCVLKAAREMKLITIGFTGANDKAMRALCDVCLAVPTTETQLVQQVHIVAAHAVCALAEADLCQPEAAASRAERR
jgi:D-sedoheptulose 7-phosphate isomerase